MKQVIGFAATAGAVIFLGSAGFSIAYANNRKQAIQQAGGYLGLALAGYALYAGYKNMMTPSKVKVVKTIP